MEKEKTVRMRFKVDMFYNDLEKPLYLKNQIYNIPERMIQRWLNRGGELVDSKDPVVAPAPVAKIALKEVVEPPKKEDEDEEDEDEDLDDADLKEDKKPVQQKGQQQQRGDGRKK